MTRPGRPLRVLLAIVLGAGCATDRLEHQASAAFERGEYEVAVAKLERAVEAQPSALELRMELRMRREMAVHRLLAAADGARSGGDGDAAATSYRRVLAIAPGNDRALRGLDDVAADRRHAEHVARAAQLLAARKLDAAALEAEAVLAEDPGYAAARTLLAKIELARGPTPAVPRLKTHEDRPVSLQFRDAPTKMVFEALARQTGLNFVFDKDVKTEGRTTIFVSQVPVEQAIDLILAQNQLGRQVLAENIALIYPNTPAKQKDYRDEIVHAFYLANAAPKDVESLLKTVLGTKTLYVDERSSTLVMRDTPEHVTMAEKLVAALDVAEPEVILEVEVLEISHSLAQQLGISYPTSISFSATKPANSAAPDAASLVLSDLGKQTASTIAVSSLGITVDLSKTVGAANLLSSPRIRARNKEKAKILVGDRLPVVTSGTSATVGGSFSTSNVQYIDVGLALEVQPTIHADGNVAIRVALEVSSIVKQISVPIGNGATTLAYQIGTRNASTLLELKDGETQVLAGLIQDVDQRSSAHIPGLGDLPIVGRLFGSESKTRDKNEIVLSITPRIVRAQARPSSDAGEFWYGNEAQTRSAPFVGAGAVQEPTSGGPVPPGSVSFQGGGAASAPAVPAPTGPRPAPKRIDVAPAPAAGANGGAAPAAPAAGPGATDATAGPKITIEGPDTAKVGDEIGVSVKLAAASPLGRIRTQVAFDASALQLVSAEPGDLASSGEAPRVDTRPGGVQLELSGGGEAPPAGGGSLVELRFRVVQARPAIAITTQVVLIGADGVAVAATQATPLNLAVSQ